MTAGLPGWREHAHAGLMGALGPLLSRKAGANWEYAILAREVHLNAAGVVHGGVITALLDQALSALAWAHAGRRPCLTIQLSLSFLGAIQPGELMVASGQVTHATRSLLFLDGKVHTDERIAATAQAVFKIVKT